MKISSHFPKRDIEDQLGGSLLILLILGLVLVPKFCYGYIDPGSGHLIWQTLVSGAIGFVFLIRKFFSDLKIKMSKSAQPKNLK